MLPKSPLTDQEILQIDSSALPNIQKHYVRLLAHCLYCFKEISKNESSGVLPDSELQLQWCLKQSSLENDKEFIPILMKQFAKATQYLESLAQKKSIRPLDLTIDDLIQASFESMGPN